MPSVIARVTVTPSAIASSNAGFVIPETVGRSLACGHLSAGTRSACRPYDRS
jgi:hypothetical protein